MILAKGSHIQCDLDDGTTVILPIAHAIIHDPDGNQINKCDVFLGPFKILRGRTELTSKARSYFGHNYKAVPFEVDLPKGPWQPVGRVIQIRYKRPARNVDAKWKGKYFHPFKRQHLFRKTNVQLSRCRSFYMLALPDGCIYDDRGFVFP